MTVGDHINIHGSMISYNIVKNKIKFKCTWVHKNDQNVLYALSSNYLSDKRRGKIRPTSFMARIVPAASCTKTASGMLSKRIRNCASEVRSARVRYSSNSSTR